MNPFQWELQKENLKDELDGLPVFATCRFGTSEICFSRVNSLVGDDNARE